VTWTGFTGSPRVGARFVAADGTLLGAPETVNAAAGGPSRAACSPGLNKCLVVWLQEPTTVMGRFIRNSGGAVLPVGDPFVVNSNGRGKLTSAGPGVAYSPASHEFLVAWTEFGNGMDVRAQRVAGSGGLLGGEIPLAVTGLWEGFPSVVHNSAQNEFMVGYYQEFANGVNAVAGKRVQPGSGAILGGNTIWTSGFALYPEFAYNSSTNQYFAITWGFAGGWMLHGQIVDAAVQAVGGVLSLAPNGGGDGIGVAYNSSSNTYFAVYQSQINAEVWGVVVGANGIPTTQFQVTVSGTALSVQPRSAGSTRTATFLAVGSNAYGSVMAQRVQDNSAPPPPPPPPPPPASNPAMSIDTPSNGAAVRASGFSIGGWAIDRAATSGTGVSHLDIWAAPVSGGPVFFVGQASTSITRSDVGAIYGQRFVPSGFTFLARLAPGVYDLHVFARSTVANAFNNSRVVRVAVTGARNAPTSDVDGDNRADATLYQPSTGSWHSLFSNGGFVRANLSQWGGPGFTPVAGDFDGDGRADRTVYREATSDWFTLKSSTGYTSTMSVKAGGPGWKPIPGDFDGDNKTDYAVYQTSTGLWYALTSSSNYTKSISILWGGGTFVPVPADFDGDGKTDPTIYFPSTGAWYIRPSSSGYSTMLTKHAGGPGYVPVAQDYDGDGKADVAVYHTSTGLWYALKSSRADTASLSVRWGGAAYQPVKGDFDGDGKADLAVYRAGTGSWHILLSSLNYSNGPWFLWGGPGYLPMGTSQ
jgi:hypothetical protein